MSKHLFRPVLGLMLSALLILMALPVTALAAESEGSDFTLIQLVATDVTLEETVFDYTGSEIRPNVAVRSNGTLLTLDQDYQLSYANNVEPGEAKVIVTGIATASETLGYTGTVEVPFEIQKKSDQEPSDPEFTLVELKDEQVTIEGTSFPYTGQPITPSVTVTVDGKTLTAGQDYALEYVNNLVPGTGTVIIRGIATASETLGYTGEIRRDFTIVHTEQSYPLVEIKDAHVTLEADKFTHTGKPITPKVTVTVDGKTLTAGKDYSVAYTDNVTVGTASVTVSGIATATENGGYTGTVKKTFSITPDYRILKGSGEIWYLESSKNLSFTANGARKDLTGVTVNGNRLDASWYTVSDDGVVTLKNSFLKKLPAKDYTITLHYSDGDAQGSFSIRAGLDASNPETGDAFPLHALAAVMFISLTALAGTAYAWYKKLR